MMTLSQHITENWKDIVAFGRFLGRYRWRIGLAGATMLSTVLLQLPFPFLTMFVIDRLIKTHDLGLFPVIVAGLFAFLVFSSLVMLFHTLLLALLREHALGTLQLELMDRLQQAPMSFFYRNHSSYLSTRIRSDLRNIQSILAGPLLGAVQSSLMFVGGVVSMAILYWKLALVTFAILPIFALTIVFFNRRIRELTLIVQESNAQYGSRLQEGLGAMPLIKGFCLERENRLLLRRKLLDLIQSTVKQEMVGSLARRFTYAVGMIAPVAVLWFGASEYLGGRITIGTFVAFHALLGYVFTPMQNLLNQNVQVQSAMVSLRRLMEFMQLPRERDGVLVRPLSGRWSLNADSVTFGYREDKRVLQDLDLIVEEGEKVALVGSSGEGKTTLLRLLLRFHDPDRGRILLGGVDIRELALRELRSNIGVVFQEPYLFSGTVEENLRHGNPAASSKQLCEAAALAQAHEFILGLIDGYKTRLGEGGVTLSAGQKMRLAIARAILKDARIILFDEPTSALDADTETALLRGLREYLSGRTTLIIAHQPSVLQIADRVCAMKYGRILDQYSARVSRFEPASTELGIDGSWTSAPQPSAKEFTGVIPCE
ncbi:MAG TPA: ABC transporter ATP-binding protein [Blastocatellia bacterium]|nr:ABC transporter ATP-binding protein [Blastocatellia bacterium]